MKKVLAVLMAGILLFSCCAAFAEGEATTSLDLSGFDFSKIPEEISTGDFALKDESSYAIAPTSDKVTVAGNMVSVQHGSVYMILMLPDAYLCLTQDYNASIQAYRMLQDPEAAQNTMVAGRIHYCLVDMYTMNESKLFSVEPDAFSMMVGNLKYLSSSDLNDFAVGFGQGAGITYTGTFQSGSALWLKYTGKLNVYVTIVGGECFIYHYGDATEADAEEILNALAIYG